jgi:hypothetical protein
VVRDRYIYLRQRTEQGLDGPQYHLHLRLRLHCGQYERCMLLSTHCLAKSPAEPLAQYEYPPTLQKAFGHRDRLACCKSYLSAAS